MKSEVPRSFAPLRLKKRSRLAQRSGKRLGDCGVRNAAARYRYCTDREAAKGKQSGRTQEIQRLIGRSLRAVVDMEALGERMIKIDCDVTQADGGTRCASITGAYVALADAVNWLIKNGSLEKSPLKGQVAALSVGIYEGVPVADFDYDEDHLSDTDMNVVMTDAGKFVELQGTAEGEPFSREDLDALLKLAENGLKQLFAAQRAALAEE